MSNIDNFKPTDYNNTKPYQKKENFTSEVVSLIEDFDNKLPFIISEFDSIEEKRKGKECKPFKEKMEGLAAMKRFHDSDLFQNLVYWYIKQPRGES